MELVPPPGSFESPPSGTTEKIVALKAASCPFYSKEVSEMLTSFSDHSIKTLHFETISLDPFSLVKKNPVFHSPTESGKLLTTFVLFLLTMDIQSSNCFWSLLAHRLLYLSTLSHKPMERINQDDVIGRFENLRFCHFFFELYNI
ncbi:hypothetical protein ACLOJK_017666 [Asimina triloba]